ncbi:hypothetical protein C4561_05175 [candidate division WWE3 bacterium]|uniref:Uncharacterized protein n=1 Tax=candidate division WWE3 bacterium TaxID=2053526 RepID=A0A3A4ZB21_UNCKA|nr:MAG: hypothetical protein C4561_05175 [candidate division WWE3 bacterium]
MDIESVVYGLLLLGFILFVIGSFLVKILFQPEKPKGRTVAWSKDRRGVDVKTVVEPNGTKHIYTFPAGRRQTLHSHKVIKDGRTVFHRNEAGRVVTNERNKPRPK